MLMIKTVQAYVSMYIVTKFLEMYLRLTHYQKESTTELMLVLTVSKLHEPVVPFWQIS